MQFDLLHLDLILSPVFSPSSSFRVAPLPFFDVVELVTAVGIMILRWAIRCFRLTFKECFFLKKVSFSQPFFVSNEKMLFL